MATEYYYSHFEEISNKAKEKYRERKEQHRCVVCGDKLPKNYIKVKCGICSKLQKGYDDKRKQAKHDYDQKKYWLYKKHNLCVSCHRKDDLTLKGRILCRRCAKKANDRRKAKLLVK